MKMNIDDFKSVLSEVRNSEEKKNLYILIGALIAIIAVAAGIAAVLVKKHCDDCEAWDDDYYDDYDDEDYCCDCDDKDFDEDKKD